MLRIARIIALCGTALLCALPAYAEPDDSFVMTPDQIKQAQRALYETNFDPGPWDGTLGAKTRSEIADWQRTNDLPATGVLTKAEFGALLKSAAIPRVWGALGSSADGAYASRWNYTSRSEAEGSALAGCKKLSKMPEKCVVVTGANKRNGVDSEWLGARFCTTVRGTTKYSAVATATSEKRNTAIQRMTEISDAEGYPRKGCKLLVLIEVSGKHKH